MKIGDEIVLGDLLSDEFERSKRVRFKLKNAYRKRSLERRSNPKFYAMYSGEFVAFPRGPLIPDGVDEVISHRSNVRVVVYDSSRASAGVDLSEYDLRLSLYSKVVVTGYGD